jgi:hypothetical protein
LKENFPKIPAKVWSPYISLCFYMCPPGTKKLAVYEHDSQLEVGVCLLRDQATLTQWKIVVPRQVVDGARVEADLRECIDISTGEEYTMFPPLGWLHAGTSHSHNTMGAFFSSVDDASELTVPGLHIVVGEIDHKKMEYSHIASIVHQKQRREVDVFDVVDVEPLADCPFHDKVLTYIKVVMDTNRKLWKRGRYTTPSYGPDSTSSYGPGSSWPWSKPDIPAVEDESGKLNGFYRFLDRTNSDLFDNLSEDVDIFTLSDNELKALAREDALEEGDLNSLRKSLEDEVILRDIADLERD